MRLRFILTLAAGALLIAAESGFGGVLANKPARSDEAYSSGWRDGCNAGANSYSLLRPLLLDRPFVTHQGEASIGPTYDSSWNLGYTTCRFYQDILHKYLLLIVVIAAVSHCGTRTAIDG